MLESSSSSLQIYVELHAAVQDLSSRGLCQAARWAAEQLVGLYAAGSEEASSAEIHMQQQQQPQEVQDQQPRFILAKTYFDAKDYRRAAHVLDGINGQKALFLRLYSLYLAGEKRKEDARIEKGGPLGRVETVNQDLETVEASLAPLLQSGTADAFCWYLHGLVELDRQKKAEGQAALVRSLHLYPCNWSTWQALQSACTEAGGAGDSGGPALALSGSTLPVHWCRDFFLASCHLELQQSQEALSKLQILSQVFANSPAVVSMVAQAHYSLQNFDEAHSLFEDLLAQDPHRLEGMDTYSNILFVKEQLAELSHLAHRATTTDKYKPETCLVVGNYYSLKGQHEKALEYFRRALKLNRHYLAAWTLMGHEYMEVKNAAAAIDAYRHAVDLNQHDYRAWYGLGQAYELLKMPYYSIYYYRRACALRPSDARMWCALAQSYRSELVGLQDEAVLCYSRAIEHGDPEDVAVPELAKLHEERGELDAAERLYRAVLQRLQEAGRPQTGQDALDALLFLASTCKDSGRLDEAEVYCQRLLDSGGPVKERAKALAREVRNLLQHAGGSGGGGAPPGLGATTPGLSGAFPGFPTQLNFPQDGSSPGGNGPGGAGGREAAGGTRSGAGVVELFGAPNGGFHGTAVEGVMQTLRVSRAEAVAALQASGGDVNAAVHTFLHR